MKVGQCLFRCMLNLIIVAVFIFWQGDDTLNQQIQNTKVNVNLEELNTEIQSPANLQNGRLPDSVTSHLKQQLGQIVNFEMKKVSDSVYLF